MTNMLYDVSTDMNREDSLNTIYEGIHVEYLLTTALLLHKHYPLDMHVPDEFKELVKDSELDCQDQVYSTYDYIFTDEYFSNKVRNQMLKTPEKYRFLYVFKLMLLSTIQTLKSPLCTKDANFSSGIWLVTLAKSFFNEYDSNVDHFISTFYCGDESKDLAISYSILDFFLDKPLSNPTFCKGFVNFPPLAQLSIHRAIPIIYPSQVKPGELATRDNLPVLIRPSMDNSVYILDSTFYVCHTWSNTSSDRYYRFLAFKCMESCLISVCSILQQHPSEAILHLKEKIPGVLNKTLEMILKNWEDPFDSIVTVIRILFNVILDISNGCIEAFGDDERYGTQYVNQIISHLLTVDWNTKGKYPLLQAIIERKGAKYILSLKNNLMDVLFEALSYDLFCRSISNLIESVLNNLKQEDLPLAESIWRKPFITSIFKPDSFDSTAVYVVPSILSVFSNSVTPMISDIINEEIEKDKLTLLQVRAVLSVLKVARRNGIIDGNYLLNDLPCSRNLTVTISDIIKHSMNSSDNSVKLDALELISDSRKLTELPNELERENLKTYIHTTLAHTFPSFRTKAFKHVELIFQRIKDGANLKYKPKRMNESDVNELVDLSRYVSSLMRKIVYSMYSASPFHRRTSAFEYFSTMANLFGDNPSKGCHFNTVLKSIKGEFHIYSEETVKFLLTGLWDSFDNNRIASHSILSKCPTVLPGFQTPELLLPLLRWAISVLNSPRMRDCDSGSLTLRIIVDKYIKLSGWTIRYLNGEFIINPGEKDDSTIDKRLTEFLGDLQALLDQHIQETQRDINQAANFFPVHGPLMAIRYIIGDYDFTNVVDKEVWNVTLRNIVALSKKASNTSIDLNRAIRYTLQDSGEEEDDSEEVNQTVVVAMWLTLKEVAFLFGCIAKKLLPEETSSTNELLEEEDLKQIGQHLLDTLLLLRHRGAIETTTDGFQAVCESFTKSKIPTLKALPQTWLNHLLDRIDNSPSQLMSTRRSAGLPFAFIALLKSEAYTDYIRKQHNLLPRAFKHLIETARRKAEPKPDSSVGLEFRHQVHSLNVIRAIMRDKTLVEDVGPFVEDVLLVVIELYNSPLWLVQNSATMTLSTLIERATGCKQSIDDYEQEIKKKSMGGITFTEFFSRFPQSHKFLVKSVEQSLHGDESSKRYVKRILDGLDSNSLEQDLAPKPMKRQSLSTSLYAILVLLTRLTPGRLESPMEKHYTEPFMEAILESTVSNDWMVRRLSARAFVRLITTRYFPTFLNQLLDSFPGSAHEAKEVYPTNRSNQLHGSLLTIYYLIKGHLPLVIFGKVIDEMFTTILPKIQKMNWLLATNLHPLVFQLLKIVYEFLFKRKEVSKYSNLLDIQVSYFRWASYWLFEKPVPQFGIVDHQAYEYCSYIASHYCINICDDKETSSEILLKLISHPYYETRLACLEILCKSDNALTIVDKNKLVCQLIESLNVENQDTCKFKENHNKAITLILKLLTKLKNYIPDNVVSCCDVSSTANLWAFLEGLINHHGASSDLVQASLVFMGALVDCVIDAAISVKLPQNACSSIICSWIHHCTKYSETDIPLEYRQAAMTSITLTPLTVDRIKLINPETSNTPLENATVDYWMAVMKLLQDDDESIRLNISIISTFVNKHIDLPLSIHSSIETCYEYLTTHFANNVHYFDLLLQSFSNFKMKIDLMEYKVLFDADKDNFFEEECFVAQVSRKQMIHILQKGHMEEREVLLAEWIEKMQSMLTNSITQIAKAKVCNTVCVFLYSQLTPFRSKIISITTIGQCSMKKDLLVSTYL